MIDDEWLSVVVYFTLTQDLICQTETINIDPKFFFNIYSSFWLLLLDRVMSDLATILDVLNDVPFEMSCCCRCIRSCLHISEEYVGSYHSRLGGNKLSPLVCT